MDKKYDSCSYKARRTFLGGEFEVRLFEVDDAGIAAVVFQISTEHGSPLKFSRVFSRAELDKAGITKTLEGHVALVDSLELIEDAYYTGNDAVSAGQNVLAAYQLSSTLPGVSFPPPIISQQAALAYFARAPIGLSTWNSSRVAEEDNLLVNLIVKGLTELCREKPPGLDAVKWLGNWFLDHNPAQPTVEVDD
ncbi:dynein light chain [Phytophthora cinnamomi]|uniref:dynein light chain n=1 Tax=Phytophthora cinnamomi TaxID=4785 RepID=UPI00355A82D6|nr:dynein light chain [Phytophthora cinnamomi]